MFRYWKVIAPLASRIAWNVEVPGPYLNGTSCHWMIALLPNDWKYARPALVMSRSSQNGAIRFSGTKAIGQRLVRVRRGRARERGPAVRADPDRVEERSVEREVESKRDGLGRRVVAREPDVEARGRDVRPLERRTTGLVAVHPVIAEQVGSAGVLRDRVVVTADLPRPPTRSGSCGATLVGTPSSGDGMLKSQRADADVGERELPVRLAAGEKLRRDRGRIDASRRRRQRRAGSDVRERSGVAPLVERLDREVVERVRREAVDLHALRRSGDLRRGLVARAGRGGPVRAVDRRRGVAHLVVGRRSHGAVVAGRGPGQRHRVGARVHRREIGDRAGRGDVGLARWCATR